jgi:hypothetical protein
VGAALWEEARRLFAVPCVAVALIAFGDIGCDAKSNSGGWEAQLKQLAETGQSVYSFRFDGAPPSGEFYTVAFHGVGAPAACERYATGLNESGDFWFLDLDINDTKLGEHAISLVERAGTPSATANVTLLHRVNDAFVESYKAVGGTVTLSSAPLVADANSGATLEGRIEVDFPTHGVQQLACVGGQARGSPEIYSSCNCKDDTGRTWTCTPDGGQDCCVELGSGSTHASIALSARPCGAMCRWASGIPCYCESVSGFGDRGDAATSNSPTCGNSICEQQVWPRLMIAYGDSWASTLTYTVTTDDGFTWTNSTNCVDTATYAPLIHCDQGYDGDPQQTLYTLTILGEGGVLDTVQIPLTPFNYCGKGMAYVIVSASDAGPSPVVDVSYISPCDLP